MIGLDLLEKTVEKGVELVFTHRENLRAVLSLSTVHRNSRLRISFAALWRLTTPKGYVLIRNVRRAQQYGPIGGVIRYFPAARKLALEELGFQDELSTVGGACDLRGYIIGKKFHGFMRWFYSKKHVEKLTLAREIDEELSEAGLDDLAAKVPRLEFDLVRVVHEGPVKVRGTDYLQYRLFHVYEIEQGEPLAVQFADRVVRATSRNSNLIVATRSEIERGITKDRALIADSSGYLFGARRVGNEPPPIQ
jgi:hypothetical protein